MRRLFRSVRQFRWALRYQRNHIHNGLAKRPIILIDKNLGSLYKSPHNLDIYRHGYNSSVISGALSTDAAKVTNGGINLIICGVGFL